MKVQNIKKILLLSYSCVTVLASNLQNILLSPENQSMLDQFAAKLIDNTENNGLSITEMESLFEQDLQMVKKDLEEKIVLQKVKVQKVPPRNTSQYLNYATEQLKSKISLEQKMAVDELQKKAGHQLSRQDSLKLLMFEEIAIKMEPELTNEKNMITGRSGSSTMKMNSHKQDSLSQISYYLDSIWNYGCWCYFGDNMSHGRGVPVNKVDQICRSLNYCYTCVKIDEREVNGRVCSPGKISYNRPTSMTMENESWEISCETNNDNNSCKINTCKCETQFVKSLISLFFSGYRFEPEYKHELNIFDPNSCGPKIISSREDEKNLLEKDSSNQRGIKKTEFIFPEKKHPQGERRCCGEFPNRKPYNSAFQGCCVQNDQNIYHVYNTEQRMCCEDGTVKMVCPDYVDG